MEIIGHGIREVIYLCENYNREKIMRTKMIFDLAGVIYRYYVFGNIDIFNVLILCVLLCCDIQSQFN